MCKSETAALSTTRCDYSEVTAGGSAQGVIECTRVRGCEVRNAVARLVLNLKLAEIPYREEAREIGKRDDRSVAPKARRFEGALQVGALVRPFMVGLTKHRGAETSPGLQGRYRAVMGA
jgi:hypothetical protein